MAGISAVVLALWWGANRWLGHGGFYAVFALAVTASVQLVWVYLVFSSLIMPALAVRRLPARWQLPMAWVAGALAYAVGLAVSAMVDWPSGAVVVITMALVCLLTGTLGPRLVGVQRPAPSGTPERGLG
jgi:zinc/manganese transport system permease protein